MSTNTKLIKLQWQKSSNTKTNAMTLKKVAVVNRECTLECELDVKIVTPYILLDNNLSPCSQ